MRRLALLLTVAVVLLGSCSAARWVTPKYDSLVRLDENVKREWAQVDVLLQRRYDLVPNLVAVVERFATGQEKEIVLQLSDSYAGYRGAKTIDEKIHAAHRTEGCLRQIVGFGALYPSLASAEQFRSLLASLERTEDGIAAERMKYNAAVGELNSSLRSIDGRLANLVARVPVGGYYQPPEAAKDSTRVAYTHPGATVMEVAQADPSGKPPGSPRTSISDAGAWVWGLRLSGVVRGPSGKRTALLVEESGRTRSVQEGDNVNSARVERIEPGQVTLRPLDIRGEPSESSPPFVLRQ